MAITITGANGEVISLPDATGRAKDTAGILQTKINKAIASASNSVGIYTDAGVYQAPSEYEYLVVADGADTTSGEITVNSTSSFSVSLNILVGRASGTTYNAGNYEGTDTKAGSSGTIVNTAGSLIFNGSGKTGGWTIYTGDGDSTINATNGNNQINTGTGKNTIVLGNGNSSVFSEGQDTITGASTGYNSVTLAGSNSEVTLGESVVVNDSSKGEHNTVSVGKNSTVFGGQSTTVTYNAGDKNEFIAGISNTVSAATGASLLKVVHGGDNTYNVEQKLNLFNGNGNTNITVNGQFIGFGSKDSSYTLNAGGSDSGLFVADAGNETLNASGATVALQIYADTVSGTTRNSNFVATGGSGNDTLVAGTGHSTFSGGAGDNLFMFVKGTSQDGNTVITDFANSSQNKIALYDYGLDDNSLASLLNGAANDTQGNAVLNLDGHSITIEGVSVSSLNADKFEVINTPVQTA